MADNDPARLAPLLSLAVHTPRLELRYATDDLLEALAPLTRDVIAPGTQPFDDGASFYDATPAGRTRWIAGQRDARERTSPGRWVLTFAVVLNGRPVGTQELSAIDFPAHRTVGTFSWLARARQGQGLGKEMREAVLHLAFDGLGAQFAVSEAFEDNGPSIGVSLAVGYAPSGTRPALRDGARVEMARFRMTRERWLARRRDDIATVGLEACLPLLGL